MKQGFHLILGIWALWQLLQYQVGVKLTRALMADFVEKQHSWIGIFTCTLDGLITALVDDAVEFAFQVSHILEQLIFLAVVVSVVKADEPPRTNAVELVVDEALIFRCNLWACWRSCCCIEII